MKISIITATLNRESTILRSQLSVKKQTYDDIQSVIVDGGSKDKSVKKVERLLTSNDILLSEPDKGIYDALNKGINVSKGEVIGFLHSDDFYYDKHVIKNVMNLFMSQDIDIVYGNVSFFYPNNPKKIIRIYRSKELCKKNLAWGLMPAHPAIFIKKKIYEKIGLFNSSYKIAGDYEFLCRLVMNYKYTAKFIPRVMVNMQMGGISTRSFKNSYILNKETFRAISNNGIYTNIFMLLSKYFIKIREFY